MRTWKDSIASCSCKGKSWVIATFQSSTFFAFLNLTPFYFKHLTLMCVSNFFYYSFKTKTLGHFITFLSPKDIKMMNSGIIFITIVKCFHFNLYLATSIILLQRVVEHLTKMAPKLMYEKDKSKRTALHDAIKHVKVVEILLTSGAKINSK
jgi:hypothetical protein